MPGAWFSPLLALAHTPRLFTSESPLEASLTASSPGPKLLSPAAKGCAERPVLSVQGRRGHPQ